jgi:hypothetical protein
MFSRQGQKVAKAFELKFFVAHRKQTLSGSGGSRE